MFFCDFFCVIISFHNFIYVHINAIHYISIYLGHLLYIYISVANGIIFYYLDKSYKPKIIAKIQFEIMYY